MQLKNISTHRPNNLIIDVAEDEAKTLIKSGEFIELTKEKLIVEKTKKVSEEKEDIVEEDLDKSKNKRF